LHGARGLAIGPLGRVFLSDTANHRVIVIDPSSGEVETIAILGLMLGQVNTPRGLDTDGSRLIVADWGGSRVQAFDLAGGYTPAVWSTADSTHPMIRPVGVSIEHETGRVFVVDEATHRVYRFSMRGMLETSWGGFGDAPGLFNGPTDIVVRSGRVYVADARNHRMQVFGTDGKYLYKWGRHTLRPHDGEGRVHYPSSIAMDPSNGRVAVGEAFESRVQFFSEETEESLRLQEEDRLVPRGVGGHFGRRIAADGTLLAVIEPETARVLIYDTREDDPIEITRLGGYGTGFGRLVSPSAVAVDDRTQRVCVADDATGMISVYKLDRDPGGAVRFSPSLGRLERAVNLQAAARAARKRLYWPPRPVDIELLDDGGMLVLDQASGQVLTFDREFALTEMIGSVGYGAAEMRLPSAFDRLPDGRFAIVEPGMGEVRIWNTRGDFEEAIRVDMADGAPFAPFEIDIEGDSILLTDRAGHRLIETDIHGAIRAQIGGPGLGGDALSKPGGVARTERGIVVCDFGNHRLIFRESLTRFRRAFGPWMYVDEANGITNGAQRGASDE